MEKCEPIICDFCGRDFLTKTSLQLHEKEEWRERKQKMIITRLGNKQTVERMEEISNQIEEMKINE